MESEIDTHKNQKPLRACKIEHIIDETPTIKSFLFRDDMEVTAGQFVMVWVPGVDEVPMSVSYSWEKKGITVARVGPTTTKLHQLEVGAKLGIRGPYGNGFDLENAKHILAVGGGCGSAPLGPVLENVSKTGQKIMFCVGAKTGDELLFKSRAKELGIEVDICTDDGTAGYHGFVTERVAEILAGDTSFDLILACGPEPMLKKLLEIAIDNNIKIQVSLERYMKCGIGICDACSIDGYQVCRHGPVFKGELLKNLNEFGASRRDAAGCVRKL